jgi:hypothetical protein
MNGEGGRLLHPEQCPCVPEADLVARLRRQIELLEDGGRVADIGGPFSGSNGESEANSTRSSP